MITHLTKPIRRNDVIMRPFIYPWIFIACFTLGSMFTHLSYAQELIVGPYLQRATTTEIWIHWELDRAQEGVVRWGSGGVLNQDSTAEVQPNDEDHWLYSVHLTNLNPSTTYQYQLVQGQLTSEVFHFKTPAVPEADAPLRLVAMSDMQIDRDRPEQFRSVVEEGVIDYITQKYSTDLAQEISLLLIPGDLVKDGLSYTQWIDDFFAPTRALLPYVPVYPVPGNHENNSPYFFQYFNLPLNGTPRFEEHWYFFDQGNVRVIGLDSNGIYRNQVQLDWLTSVLDSTCMRPEIDFVFAQLHHPHHSELWPEGNTRFTGAVIEILESFSTRCGKPSVHFYGHTHGYSRGHAQDHRHVMVNVASAGGNLDEWGEYDQIDYPEHVVSQDEYGFVVVDVEAGENPAFEIQRLSMGTASEPLNHELKDRLRIRRFNQSPDQPRALGELGQSVNARCFTLALYPFEDPDDDPHGATQWQVSARCEDFSDPIIDQWRQRENWYQGVDLQLSDDLTDEVIEDLITDRAYCWRARYRDEGLSWSEWSTPQAFRTSPRGEDSDEMICDPPPIPQMEIEMMEHTSDDATVVRPSSEDAEVMNETDQGLSDLEEPYADQSSEQNLREGGCITQAQAHPSSAFFLVILCLMRALLHKQRYI